VISLAPGPAYGGMCVLNRGEYEEEKYIIYCETNIEQVSGIFIKLIENCSIIERPSVVDCLSRTF
jgi:hypothetical protein